MGLLCSDIATFGLLSDFSVIIYKKDKHNHSTHIRDFHVALVVFNAVRVSIIVGEELAKSYREARENRSGRLATRQQKRAKRAALPI